MGASESIIVKAACPHDCPDTCAMHVTVRDGVAIKVAGDPDHPTTRGSLCTKVSRYLERTYHKDRLLHPLRRVGNKGEGRFERITWDQALDEIAARLKPIIAENPEQLLPYSYAGTMGLVQSESIAARFFHALGASRLDRTICASAGTAGNVYTLGAGVGFDIEYVADAKLILIWGCNAIVSNLHFWSAAQEAKRRGAKLIAIDPYRSLTAEKCHQHIALLPGTDGALALGIMHILIRDQRLDHDYIANYTLGFDALVARAATFPPQRVADICGITVEEIEQLARDYGTIKPSAIRLNYGLQRVRGGANAVRAILSLPALVGAWRDPGGGALLSTSGFYGVNADYLQRPDLMLGYPQKLPRIINMSDIGHALLNSGPYADSAPVKALMVYNSNPVAVAPDSSKVAQGFERDDLFTVVLEHFKTDTVDYADIVLPATTQLEHLDVHKSYGHLYVLANNPAIAPLGESKPNSEIFRLLAARMGLTDPCFSESDESLAAQAFKTTHPGTHNYDWQQLKRDGWKKLAHAKPAPFAEGGFLTPSGKCEFYSERLKAQGHDPLPNYLPPHESPESTPQLAQKYPLRMISPPARNFLNSTFVNVESLRATEGEPHLDIHPDDAVARNIADGGTVRVFNDRGSMTLKARVTDRARRGVVVALSIWWKKLAHDHKNANELTSQALTDLGSGATFYDLLVQVEAS